MHLHGYSEEKSSEPNQGQKVNNHREMALSLDGASGDISEVGQRRDVGNRLSPGREFVQWDKDAADEYHRESHGGGNHVYQDNSISLQNFWFSRLADKLAIAICLH